MRTFLALLLAFSGARALMAQAVLDVYFGNFGPGLLAPVYAEDGVTGLAGANFHAELTYDATPLGGSSTTVVAPTAQFIVPGMPGLFGDGTTRQISGFNAGDSVTLRVRAWDKNSGDTYDVATLRGVSGPFSLTVPTPPAEGQPPAMAQWLTGLQSFDLAVVPEPAETAAIIGLACVLFSLWRRFGSAAR